MNKIKTLGKKVIEMDNGVSKEVLKIIELMEEDPSSFVEGAYTLEYIPNNISIWVANGKDYYAFYKPVLLDFCEEEKGAFDLALDKWRRKKIADVIEALENE